MSIIYRTALVLTIGLCSTFSSCSSNKMQLEEHYIEVLRNRKITEAEFSDPNSSPLTPEDLRHFHGLDYFDIDYSKTDAPIRAIK